MLVLSAGALAAPFDRPGASPATASVNASYVLGADDLLSVRILQAPDLADKPVRIDLNGFISLPFLGNIKAAGLTLEQLRDELQSRYAAIIRQPQVTVSVEEYRSQPVSVIGAVNTPGVHQIRGKKSVVEALSLAGGLRQDAGSTINITRSMQWGLIPLPSAEVDRSGQYSVASIDVKQLMDGHSPQVNIAVLPDDVISVSKAEMVYVIGEVPRTGGYVLNERRSMSLLEALTLAGGINHGTASPEASRILRLADNTDQRVEIPVDLKRVMKGGGKDVQLMPGDILFIPGSNAKRASIRAIEAMIQVGTGIAIWRR